MTEAIVLALISAVPTVATLIVSILNSRKSSAIHVLVNSRLDAIKAELAETKAALKAALALVAQRTE